MSLLATQRNGTAWLDADGYHVWTAHDCAAGREETMLPWPQWSAQPDGTVWPSVMCDACGAHYFCGIGPRS